MFRVKETTMPFHYNETVISEDSITTYTALDAVLRRYAEEHPGEPYIGAFLEHMSDFDQSTFFETALRDGPHHLFTDDYDTIWILGPYGLCCLPLVNERYVFQLWKPHYFPAAVVHSVVNDISVTCFEDDKIPRFAFDICEGVIVEFVDEHRHTHRVENTTFVSFSATRTITHQSGTLSPRGREILFLLKQETCRIRLAEAGATFVVQPLGYKIEVLS